MNNDYSVRKPTKEELVKIADALMKSDVRAAVECDDFTPVEVLEDYCVIVIDGYESDAPSYEGTVVHIIWGEVSFFTQLLQNKDGSFYVGDDVERNLLAK